MRANPVAAQEAQAGAPPSQDEVSITTHPNIDAKLCEMHIKLEKPGWIIRSVILYSDTLFTGGSLVVHPAESTNQVKASFTHAKNTCESVDIRVLIGAGINAPFFVCHQVPAFQLPQFAFIAPLKTQQLHDRFPMTESHVKFTLRDTQMEQIENWVKQTFLANKATDLAALTTTDSQMMVRLIDVRNHDSLVILAKRVSQDDYASFNVWVRTEEIETASDIV